MRFALFLLTCIVTILASCTLANSNPTESSDLERERGKDTLEDVDDRDTDSPINFQDQDLQALLEKISKSPGLTPSERETVALFNGGNKDSLRDQLECYLCKDHLNADSLATPKCGHFLHKACHPQHERDWCPMCRGYYALAEDQDTNVAKLLRILEEKKWIPPVDPARVRKMPIEPVEVLPPVEVPPPVEVQPVEETLASRAIRTANAEYVGERVANHFLLLYLAIQEMIDVTREAHLRVVGSSDLRESIRHPMQTWRTASDHRGLISEHPLLRSVRRRKRTVKVLDDQNDRIQSVTGLLVGSLWVDMWRPRTCPHTSEFSLRRNFVDPLLTLRLMERSLECYYNWINRPLAYVAALYFSATNLRLLVQLMGELYDSIRPRMISSDSWKFQRFEDHRDIVNGVIDNFIRLDPGTSEETYRRRTALLGIQVQRSEATPRAR